MLLLRLLFCCLTIIILVITSNQDVNGIGIEIKKYKIINSKDICGDNFCSPINEQKAKNGKSFQNNKVCGYTVCNAKTMPKPSSESNSALNIEPLTINNQNYLLFKGKGWHNLHNVEITIASQTFDTVIKSQTDDRGNLYMPWMIPEEFSSGTYSISATDGIRNKKSVAEIEIKNDISVNIVKNNRCVSTKTPINWSDCDLYGKILTNVDLRNAKLRNANLFGATLENKDLSGADLSNANLKKANLDGAIMIGTDLSYSSMIDAEIREANLSNAKIRFAKLYRTDFTGSNLSNVDFTGSTLSYANLSFTNLKDANLENTGTWATNLNQCTGHPICNK